MRGKNLKDKLIISLKGAILGFVGLAVPGLSASTIGIEIGIYFVMIDIISDVFKNLKRNAVFLLFLGIGYLLGAFIGSIAVNTIYVSAPFVMISLIIGMILGGIPKMAKNLKEGLKSVSCWAVMIILIVLLLAFSFFVTAGRQITFVDMDIKDYIILFGVGIFTSTTLIIPGVDFAVLLLSLGYYNALTGLIANIFDFSHIVGNLLILVIYLSGYGIGCIIFAKLIKKLIRKYEIQTRFASFAFVITAPAIIIKKNIFDNPAFFVTTPQLVLGIVLFICGLTSILLLTRYLSLKQAAREKAPKSFSDGESESAEIRAQNKRKGESLEKEEKC